jgi:transcription-repair coupling factor (superfamily II helicase)
MGFSPLELPVEIKWQVSAYLPAEYVPVESRAVAFYKRCSMAREARELKDLSEELRDRYGNIPPQAQNLLAVSLLRLRCRQCQIESVGVTGQGFRVKPRGDLFDFLKKAQAIQDKFKEIKRVSAGVEGTILFEMHRWNADAGIRYAAKILGHLAVGKEG